jgi:L-ascorbate metabolism protein UlaG (beta-lactamase superfamily)
LPHIDLILLSHAHFDHFDLATLRGLERAGTAVVTAKYTSDLLRVQRYQSVQEVGWDERVRVGPLSITGIRVKHWGARMRSDVHRGYNGYLIETGRHRVVFGGDTAWTDSFKAVRAAKPVDLAIMPIGAYDPWILRALQSRGGLAHGRRLRRRASAAGASPDVPAEPRT